MTYRSDVTTADLEEALNRLAILIDRHGDGYWPIYERLEEELTERQRKRERLKTRISKLHSIQPATSQETLI